MNKTTDESNTAPAAAAGGERLGERELSKLRWRCRRGLLENDLFVQRFFRQHEETITTRQAEGLTALMDLADNDLLDLLLARQEPQGEVDTLPVREVLALMRNAPLGVSLQAAPLGAKPQAPAVFT